MKDIALQLLINGMLKPYSKEDQENLENYKPFQILKGKLSGVKKPRSYRQLKAYWACCGTVAENSIDPTWNTKKQVDFHCRVECKFYDPDLISVDSEGRVHFSYRSISYANLNHIEACDYFSRAFKLMAYKLGITVEELIKNSEA